MWYSINVYFCSSHKLEIISQQLLKILFSSIHDEFLVLSFKVYDDIISASYTFLKKDKDAGPEISVLFT